MIPLFLSLFLGTVLVSSEPAVSSSNSENPAAEASVTETQNQGVGTVVDLEGSATAEAQDGEERELGEGDSIYLNEVLSTAADSTLQLELNDESIFTISENTTLKVTDFVYDASAQKGSLTSSVAKGIFRYVSGNIEKLNPEKVNIEIPSGTIGIRGTIVVGEIDGENCLVALEPEEGDKVAHKIVIFNEAGGKRNEVEITQPGFATRIEARGRAPQALFQLPEEKRNHFQQRLPQPPKFPQGTRPGTPERYQHLFDPSQRMMKQGGDLEKSENKRSQRPGKEEEDSQKNFQGPNGPGGGGPNGSDSPDGFKGPQGPGDFQGGNNPENFEKPGERNFPGRNNFDGDLPQRDERINQEKVFQEGFDKPGDQFEGMPREQNQFQPGPDSGNFRNPQGPGQGFGSFRPSQQSFGKGGGGGSFQHSPPQGQPGGGFRGPSSRGPAGPQGGGMGMRPGSGGPGPNQGPQGNGGGGGQQPQARPQPKR